MKLGNERTKTVNVKFGINAINSFSESARTSITKVNNKELYHFVENWIERKLKVDRQWIKENGVDLQLKYIILPILAEKLKNRKVLSDFDITIWEGRDG